MSTKDATLAFMFDRIAGCAQILVECDRQTTATWTEVARLAAVGELDRVDETILGLAPTVIRAGQAFDTMTKLIALARAIRSTTSTPVAARVAGSAADLEVDASKLDIDGPLRASVGKLSPELFAVVAESHRAQCTNPNCRVMAIMEERINAEAH